MTPNTDSPNADAPDAYDYDAGDDHDSDYYDVDYPKSIHLFLCHLNCNRNITPKIQKNSKNMTPNTDAPDAADNVASYPYSSRSLKNKKNNMTPNTYAPDDDAPNVSDYYAAFPDSIILYSSLQHKIDPKSMLKLF